MKPLSDYQQKFDRLHDDCPVRAALDVIRGRWKPSILCELNTGAKRFSELESSLRVVTPQALTVQLRQLEADGVISRAVYPEIPPRVEYQFTELGASLSEIMNRLETWGAEYLHRQSTARSGEVRVVNASAEDERSTG